MKKQIILLFSIAAVYIAVYYGLQYNLSIKTASSISKPITVVIDAGHGGEDGGAVSRSGIKESDINLAVSIRLEQILALCGIHTKMVRTEDVGVHLDGNTVHERKMSDLKQRAAIVNAAIPSILVSIHQNHFDQEKYSGAQVFYAASHGSKELAGVVQNSLRNVLSPENRRETKAADTVYLLEHIDSIGILVECGFLSNHREANLLCTSDYQMKIACAIGSALAQFLEEGNYFEI